MDKTLIEELAQIVTQVPFNKILGLSLDDIGKGTVTLSFSMKEELIGNLFYGILHGGVISSVLDMAGGVAAMTCSLQRPSEKSFEELKTALAKSGTVNLQISYLQPGKGERFFAKAAIIHSGKHLCFVRMELLNEENTLIATGEATYSLGY